MAEPDPLAVRVRSLIAQQDDGIRAILTPGDRDLRRVAGAAQALTQIGALRPAPLDSVLRQLAAAWRPDLGAFADDAIAAQLAAQPTDLEARYDLLRLNVEVGDFLVQAKASTNTPDFTALIASLEGSDEQRIRLVQARAARLGAPSWGGFAGPSECTNVADHVRRNDADAAVALLLRMRAPADCRAALSPLMRQIEDTERAVVAAIHRAKTYGDGDVIALDQLRVLASAAGRQRVPQRQRETARWLLSQIDSDAGRFGRVTRPEIVAMLGRLLDGERPPAAPHLIGRLETLISLGGSLATGVATDWYTTALMAHAAHLSGAAPAREAAELFGAATMRPLGTKSPDWVLGFVGLHASADALSSVEIDQDEPTAELLLAKALLARATGQCDRAPAAGDYGPAERASPADGLFRLLALTLTRHCAPELAALHTDSAGKVERPQAMPDLGVRGELYRYWAQAEAVCLANGVPSVTANMDTYLRVVAEGSMDPALFDPLDLYSALRLRQLSTSGCAGGWWHGLGDQMMSPGV